MIIDLVRLYNFRCCFSLTLDPFSNMDGFLWHAKYITFECHPRLLTKMSSVVGIEYYNVDELNYLLKCE